VEAARLAPLHGVEPQRSRIAALGHDLVRHKRGDELLQLTRDYSIETDEVERATPILVHGPVAARMLGRDYGFADAEVLAGIDCHTTARRDMAPVEKVLFIADKCEPEKLQSWPACREVLDLAQTDLDAALLRFLDLHFEQAVRKGWTVHQRSLEARNQLLLRSSSNK
jgi:predicted HD superfamily hydrolase involved in NAD metabolism